MNHGKIITFLSGKGGVGKTILATNLAIALAQESGNETALLDFNFSFGEDIPAILDVHQPKDLKYFLKECTENTGAKQQIPAKYGIKILSGNNSSNIDAGLKKLKQEFSYVIIDTGADFSDNLLTILDNTELVLLVTTPDTMSINHCGFVLEKLKSLHFSPQVVRVVLNREDIKYNIEAGEIEKYTGRDIFMHLPDDSETTLQSINSTAPFVVEKKDSPISKAVRKMASHIVSDRDRKGEPVFLKHEIPGQIEKTEEKITAGENKEKTDKNDEIKRRIHRQLVREMNLKDINACDSKKSDELKQEVEKKIGELMERGNIKTTSRQERVVLVKGIMDEVLGLGPLEDLLRDDTVSEIMVNAPDRVYIERHGRIEKSGKAFIDDSHIARVIERIISPLGRRIDESSPYVDARLPDGSRVNAIIPPLSLEGPSLTVRKFTRNVLTIKDLIRLGTLNEKIADFLELCVKSRKNILISGGTGTGKTTLLNIVSGFIPYGERIITIEDSAELRLTQEHVVRLESRPPNIEGKGAVTMRDLVRNSLRMRPDRIVIGECRGGEALDMLQAMNTGHDGSITTVHSNSARDAISRLETMVLMAGADLPLKAVKSQIASAIQVIIHVSRFFSDGSRKIMQVTEVTGLEQDVITLQDIFLFGQDGLDRDGRVRGNFKVTGFVPTFLGEVKERGGAIDMGIFRE